MSKIIGYIDEDVLLNADALDTYFDGDYDEQIGGYIPDVFTEYDQTGKGFGSILRGALHFFRPVGSFLKSGLKSALSSVAKQGLAAAGGYLGDVVAGQPWKDAGRQRAEEAVQALKERMEGKLQRMQGAGQYGGNKKRRRSVKVFSLSQPARARGCVTKRRRRRRRKGVVKKAPTKRRRAQKRRTPKRGAHKVRKTRKRRQAGGNSFWL